jgi:lysophospholipase L1-like esterase
MRQAMALVQQHDQERIVMQGYNETVRRVAEDMNVVLVDLARQFPRQPGMFNDVVHPSVQGHQRIAALLAASIHQLESP